MSEISQSPNLDRILELVNSSNDIKIANQTLQYLLNVSLAKQLDPAIMLAFESENMYELEPRMLELLSYLFDLPKIAGSLSQNAYGYLDYDKTIEIPEGTTPEEIEALIESRRDRYVYEELGDGKGRLVHLDYWNRDKQGFKFLFSPKMQVTNASVIHSDLPINLDMELDNYSNSLRIWVDIFPATQDGDLLVTKDTVNNSQSLFGIGINLESDAIDFALNAAGKHLSRDERILTAQQNPFGISYKSWKNSISGSFDVEIYKGLTQEIFEGISFSMPSLDIEKSDFGKNYEEEIAKRLKLRLVLLFFFVLLQSGILNLGPMLLE